MSSGFDLITPFVQASVSVMEMLTCKKLEAGEKTEGITESKDSSIYIKIGIVGELNGFVVLELAITKAMEIASMMMCGMPVTELDDMARSAISELTNMIMGNAATVFSVGDILIDITPPVIEDELAVEELKNHSNESVGLFFEGEEYIRLNIYVKENA